MNKVDAEYIERRKKEKMAQNIIKWWNVQRNDTSNYIGSLDLEDPIYGCHIYVAPEKPSATECQDPSSSYEAPASIENTPEEDAEALRLANEIFERLSREADADEAKKQAEIEAAKQEQLAAEGDASDSCFNESTGSYSGLYGQKPMDASEADQFAAIMAKGSISSNVADLVKQNLDN